jgi:hypothetical protein
MVVAYLFGAGISISAGFPKTADITEAVLEEEIYQNNNGGWSLGRAPSDIQVSAEAEDIRKLLRFLKYLAVDYYQGTVNCITYEDLSYLVEQISNSRSNYDNPALQPLIEQIRANILPHVHCKKLLNFWGEKYPVESLATHATTMIRCITAKKIKKSNNQVSEPLIQLLKEGPKPLFLAVLNHDCLVENSLDHENMPFVDGFKQSNDGYRLWQPRLFDDESSMHLYKLHGTVNWYRVDLEENGNIRRVICAMERGRNDYKPVNPTDEPYILTGRFNKMLEYLTEPYVTIFNTFLRRLRDVQLLVISGYSFGDKGINTVIINWLEEDMGRRMVVVHPNFGKKLVTDKGSYKPLVWQMRQAIKNNWEKWKKESQLVLIEDKFENLTWDRIEEGI